MTTLPLEEDAYIAFDESSPPSTPSTKEVKVGTPATQASDGSSGADDVDLEKNDSVRKVLFEDDKNEEATPEVKGTPTKRMYIFLALIFVVIAVVVPVAIVFAGKDDDADTSRSIIAPTEPTTPAQPTSPAEPSTPAEPTAPAETRQPTAPFIAPTNPPTTPIPTSVPTTSSPTPAPATSSPTPAPTTSSPTPAPTTSSPTPVPTVDRVVPLVNFLAGQTGSTISEDPTSSMNLALQFLLEQDDAILFDKKLVQRFALISLDYALSPRVQDYGSTEMADTNNNTNAVETRTALSWSIPNVDECSWGGVVCDGDFVTKLLFGGLNLEGNIPSQISMLSGLKHLDMTNNMLSGPLPEELYDLRMLEAIYLYKNELSGSLTKSIARLENLAYLCLNDNSFTGNLPTAWKSTTFIRPLHWLNLYNNGFTGPIPDDLRWRQMFYFDVGYNQLTGQLPDDLGDKFASLRHLHLDHNQFSGTLPAPYTSVGGNRLESLTVDHNRLGGAVPSSYVLYNKLVYYTLDNNNFNSRLDKNICKLGVFVGGENVEFQADCGICSCGGIMCTNCVS